jgi:hypothetical protein
MKRNELLEALNTER